MQHNLISFLSKGKAVSKILSCCAVLVFVFVLISTDYQASAAGVPISVPQVPFELGPLIKSYDDLNDDQKKIADAIAGGYGTAYSGYAGYSYDGTWTDAAHELSVQITKYGSNIYNTLRGYLGDTGTELLLNPVGFGITTLQNILGGAVSYASQWSGTFADWWSDNIYDDTAGGGGGGHSFVVDGDVNMNQGFMNLLGPGIGLYNWQFEEIGFSSNVTYSSHSMTSVAADAYYSALNQLSYVPLVRFNELDYSRWSFANSLIRGELFSTYRYMFYDTDDHYIYFCDVNGNVFSGSESGIVTYPNCYATYVYTSTPRVQSGQMLTSYFFRPVYVSNWATYSTYADMFQAFYNGSISRGNVPFIFYEDFILDCLVGSSFGGAVSVRNIDDLNFDDTYERTVIDNPAIPFAIDLAKLIRSLIDDLAGTRDAVDGVTIRDATIGATIDKVTGLDITDAQVQKIAVQVEYPESGIIIPDGIFGGSMSYIEYLWNFTKPLVLYTRDLLHTLLFNGNGIAWIVYGIISVGLIGGVIVKFLL